MLKASAPRAPAGGAPTSRSRVHLGGGLRAARYRAPRALELTLEQRVVARTSPLARRRGGGAGSKAFGSDQERHRALRLPRARRDRGRGHGTTCSATNRIPFCTECEIDGELTRDFLANRRLERARARHEYDDGWRASCGEVGELPARAPRRAAPRGAERGAHPLGVVWPRREQLSQRHTYIKKRFTLTRSVNRSWSQSARRPRWRLRRKNRLSRKCAKRRSRAPQRLSRRFCR